MISWCHLLCCNFRVNLTFLEPPGCTEQKKAKQVGKQSQMVPMVGAKPPAEMDVTPDWQPRVNSKCQWPGSPFPGEKRSSSPLLEYFETVL